MFETKCHFKLFFDQLCHLYVHEVVVQDNKLVNRTRFKNKCILLAFKNYYYRLSSLIKFDTFKSVK